MQVQGWEDGDYYPELCTENGGANPKREELFRSLPFHFSSNQWLEIETKTIPFLSHPHLGTDSDSYRFPIDIYLSSSEHVVVYNSMLGCLLSYKPSFLESISGLKLPPWLKDVHQNQ